MTQLLQRLSEYRGEIITSIVETGVMMGNSLLAAILVGLPIGTLLHLARPGGPYPRRWLYRALNVYVNVVRSVPFLLFVVALIPFTRWLVGTSFGTTAASVPLAFVAAALRPLLRADPAGRSRADHRAGPLAGREPSAAGHPLPVLRGPLRVGAEPDHRDDLDGQLLHDHGCGRRGRRGGLRDPLRLPDLRVRPDVHDHRDHDPDRDAHPGRGHPAGPEPR